MPPPDKRFSNSFFVQGANTYSRLEGNYPGLFSTETLQEDPNLTSLYDLPELMANRYGFMGLDRPHNLKIDGFYQFDFKEAGALILGASVRGESGIPHNALAAHWAYGAGESFLLSRGSSGRSPFTSTLDVKATYGKKIGKTNSIEAFVDIFNLLNAQEQIDADEIYTGDPANPIVGGTLADAEHSKTIDPVSGLETATTVTPNKNFNNLNARQTPRSVQLGFRVTF